MSSPEVNLKAIQEQALQLPVGDRLALLKSIVASLEVSSFSDVPENSNHPEISDSTDVSENSPASRRSQARRAASIQKMRGLLKTNHPAPTDAEVQKMLEERLTEKYLQ